MAEKNTIQADFDRIAELAPGQWDHNAHYHSYLLKHLPLQMESALEIGCGTGAFARMLANRTKLVTAVDLSPQMLQKAREQSGQYTNIDFRQQDVMESDFKENSCDCIVSIATAHHLPLAEFLGKAEKVLKPGGVLLLLDLYQQETAGDYLTTLAAIPANLLLMLVKTGRLSKSREEIKAWEEHGKHDTYMTLKDIQRVCREVLPGTVVKRHLFWRYSLYWRKG